MKRSKYIYIILSLVLILTMINPPLPIRGEENIGYAEPIYPEESDFDRFYLDNNEQVSVYWRKNQKHLTITGTGTVTATKWKKLARKFNEGAFPDGYSIGNQGGTQYPGWANPPFSMEIASTVSFPQTQSTYKILNKFGAFENFNGTVIVKPSFLEGSTNLNGLFRNSPDVNPTDLSGLNTSTVENFSSMFEGASSANVDVSSWDMSSAKNLTKMFYQASSAKPDVSNWRGGYPTVRMIETFYGVDLSSSDFSGWNFSIGNAEGMFQNAKFNRKIDLSNIDTKNLTSTKNMFRNAREKNNRNFTVDLNWNMNTKKLHDTSMMLAFYKASNMKELTIARIPGIDNPDLRISQANVANFELPWRGPYKVSILGSQTVNRGPFSSSQPFNFEECQDPVKIMSIGSSHNLNSSGGVKANWVDGESKLIIETNGGTNHKLDIDYWAEMGKKIATGSFRESMDMGGYPSVDPWKNTEPFEVVFKQGVELPAILTFLRVNDDPSDYMEIKTGLFEKFYGQVKFEDPEAFFDVTDISCMFREARCNPDVSNWNTSKIAEASGLFEGNKLADPDVSNWNTVELINADSMFAKTSKADPDVSAWDTKNLKSAHAMFYETEKANPDVKRWNTGELEKARAMFCGAKEADPDVSG